MSAVESSLPAPGTDAVVAPAAPEDVASMFNLSKTKKKKKKKNDTEAEDAVATSTEAAPAVVDASIEDPASYTYEEMLDRVMNKLHELNPELSNRTKHTMKPPQLMRVGTKKTLWVNFQEICKMMHRNPEHVLQFTLSELGTEGSIDGSQRLVIRGRYVPKYIESLLRKYITEYVTCQMCRSPNTTLTRDNVSRLHFVHCQECGSSRSVAAIRSGFHAATRADRRAARK
ncbi:translation initiation factor 2 subunit 2 [Saprolegnia diclina VS20]|uniref:Translation initiation factor 2 subunit 2 n=2 Tax=Saprolegnia TaxID=4769 RepID=T0Q2P4_SAPDV|nr:translation initiation factor 2 subunit 2 [Saprolegnia diclina VS20]EQC32104.1 translation initiation factor 2 subunit 2 [Saprolegnia diclina VS20]|eukprot:XP_008614506.1 translation initiation factor 2 subunit 2 [Saprolegnia diclina VS20]